MTREFIISEIQRTSRENNGKALGIDRFYQETSIKKMDWYGKYWSKWGDAIKEAGFEPNSLNPAFPSTFLFEKLVELVKELNEFPTSGQLRLKARQDKSFPSHNTFERFGNKSEFINAFKDYCTEKGHLDLIQYCTPPLDTKIRQKESDNIIEENGSVYLYKSGRHYKIGRTNDLKRRDREIKLQLPVEAELIHRISTDDPVGIEKYWHSRFAVKRLNGEWFNLSVNDLKAFKRRKFM